ncbi:hypothetical protein HQ529_03925 [Candidatus Woesearchaeota archaeon]|nr:hypothetical protein [Candidatus Woesearchaeota archaeon]
MKKAITALFAVMIIGIMSIGFVSAYKGDITQKGPYFSEERHELMEQAFENNDYDAWKTLMTENGRNPRVVDVVTEDNFATFAQIHEAKEAGDYETALALRAELGLGMKDGSGQGRQGSGMRMQQNNFVDADNDGNCDNTGSKQNLGKRGRR